MIVNRVYIPSMSAKLVSMATAKGNRQTKTIDLSARPYLSDPAPRAQSIRVETIPGQLLLQSRWRGPSAPPLPPPTATLTASSCFRGPEGEGSIIHPALVLLNGRVPERLLLIPALLERLWSGDFPWPAAAGDGLMQTMQCNRLDPGNADGIPRNAASFNCLTLHFAWSTLGVLYITDLGLLVLHSV
jgi:hypothetical protein